MVFQHHPQETAGELAAVLQGRGNRLRTVELFNGLGVPSSVPADLDDVDGIVSMGGPMNVDQADAYPWIEQEMALIRMAHEAGQPIVGICLGAQLIAAALGGKVAPMQQPEAGFSGVKLTFGGTTDPLLAGIPWLTPQFHLHAQEACELPSGAVPLAGSAGCEAQAFRVGAKTYCFQYHFEWDRRAIEHFSQDGLVAAAGLSPQEIARQCDEHYDTYRRLGDRLCDNIATLLFPIDKR